MKLATGPTFFVWLLAVVLFLLPLNSALAEETCANQNSAVTATTPTTDFTLHDNGTVTHNPTGLVWMRCSLGQSWDGATCTDTDTATNSTWQQALAAAQYLNDNSGFAGHNDWRLPNKNELKSIVEGRCWSPAINAAIFPSTPSDWFWSSSPYAHADHADLAWYVNFNYGMVDYNHKSNEYRVRLVRAGK